MKTLRSSAFCHPVGLALLLASALLAAAVWTIPQLASLSGRANWLLAIGILSYLATTTVLLRTRTSTPSAQPPSTPDLVPTAPRPQRAATLTPREIEVLRLIACGRTAKQIAAELCVEESTVRRHVQNIYDKIDAQNIADATRWYIEHYGFPKAARDSESTVPHSEPGDQRTR